MTHWNFMKPHRCGWCCDAICLISSKRKVLLLLAAFKIRLFSRWITVYRNDQYFILLRDEIRAQLSSSSRFHFNIQRNVSHVVFEIKGRKLWWNSILFIRLSLNLWGIHIHIELNWSFTSISSVVLHETTMGARLSNSNFILMKTLKGEEKDKKMRWDQEEEKERNVSCIFLSFKIPSQYDIIGFQQNVGGENMNKTQNDGTRERECLLDR